MNNLVISTNSDWSNDSLNADLFREIPLYNKETYPTLLTKVEERKVLNNQILPILANFDPIYKNSLYCYEHVYVSQDYKVPQYRCKSRWCAICNHIKQFKDFNKYSGYLTQDNNDTLNKIKEKKRKETI